MKAPTPFKARVYFSIPGQLDLSGYCKFIDFKNHPIMQWVTSISARAPKVITMLAGWPVRNQPWLQFDLGVTLHLSGHYDIIDWNERENEILDCMVRRGEILMHVHAFADGTWRPHQ